MVAGGDSFGLPRRCRHEMGLSFPRASETLTSFLHKKSARAMDYLHTYAGRGGLATAQRRCGAGK